MSSDHNRVLVVGGARSGVAVCNLLRKHDFQVILTDRDVVIEKKELEEIGVVVVDGGHPDFLLCRYDLVVKNPGISLTAPFLKQLIELGNVVVNEIEVASRLTDLFVYGAITGTNGKTTTTSLLYAFLLAKDKNALVAGNIGIPLSTQVLVCEDRNDRANEHRNYVIDEEAKKEMMGTVDENIDVAIELSSFQLQTMPTFRPLVSVILNLTPDHLDFHRNLDEYYGAKTNIYRNLKESDYFLRNADDVMVMQYTKDIPCRVIHYSMDEKDDTYPRYPMVGGNASATDQNVNVDVYRRNHRIYFHNVVLFDEREMKLVGAHNVQNAMVAACMAYLMGVTPKQIQSALAIFPGVEHRLEFVRELHGVRYYNDSKATNVDAAKIALLSFPDSIIWLAGGKDKKTGYEGLKPYLNRVKVLIAFGESKEGLAALMREYHLQEQVDQYVMLVDSLDDAVKLAHKLAIAGDVVLLAPACSSFDQFLNFEIRGRVFKQMVGELG